MSPAKPKIARIERCDVVSPAPLRLPKAAGVRQL